MKLVFYFKKSNDLSKIVKKILFSYKIYNFSIHHLISWSNNMKTLLKDSPFGSICEFELKFPHIHLIKAFGRWIFNEI